MYKVIWIRVWFIHNIFVAVLLWKNNLKCNQAEGNVQAIRGKKNEWSKNKKKKIYKLQNIAMSKLAFIVNETLKIMRSFHFPFASLAFS